MIESCRHNFCHFNADWVKEVSGYFYIIEKKEAGKSKASFQSEKPCIMIKAQDNSPLLWSLKQRKCAEGAIVSFNDDGAHLHLVELKGNVGLETWRHVLHQFEGMYLTSLAVLKLLEIDHVESVTCYIGAKADKISQSPLGSSSPALLKVIVGGDKTLGGREEWLKESIELPFRRTAKLIKGWKDNDGNVEFPALN
jgi:hypothetical protein